MFKGETLTRVRFKNLENTGSIITKSLRPATKQWILWSASKWMTDRVPPELIHRLSSCRKSLNVPHIMQASSWREKGVSQPGPTAGTNHGSEHCLKVLQSAYDAFWLVDKPEQIIALSIKKKRQEETAYMRTCDTKRCCLIASTNTDQ